MPSVMMMSHFSAISFGVIPVSRRKPIANVSAASRRHDVGTHRDHGMIRRAWAILVFVKHFGQKCLKAALISVRRCDSITVYIYCDTEV